MAAESTYPNAWHTRHIRRADQKLRAGDSITTRELRVLETHYRTLADLLGVLPQFYCAWQEALRRLHQVQSYLTAREREPRAG